MKNIIKQLDSIISARIFGHTIGVYPELLGLMGNIRLFLFGKDNYRKNGFISKMNFLFPERVYTLLEGYLSNSQNDFDFYKISPEYTINNEKRVFFKISNHTNAFDGFKEHIEKLMGLKLKLHSIECWRNFPISIEHRKLISADWHLDRRPTNWIRVFVLINDVNEHQGPFTFFPKYKTKEIISMSKFNRDNVIQNDVFENLEPLKFVGNQGDFYIVDTQKCLHRAGIVSQGYKRDILQFIFKY